jgi:peptide/nickel transport system permease protein
MDTLRYVLSRTAGKISAAVLAVVVLVVVFGKTIAPYDALAQDPSQILRGPNGSHWLGTDYVGRDVLSRLLSGSSLSVVSALQAVAIGLVLGVIPAVASVQAGRVVEWATLRVMDSFMALPFITFAIAMAALLGNGLRPAMLAVGILVAPTFFRVTRAATLTYKRQQYVEAAQLFGYSGWRVVWRHVIRKIVPTILVTAGGVLAASLLVVASLTFLGVGVQPPAPTWGGMLASDLDYLTQRPFGPLAPALAIMFTVASIGVLSDLVRDHTSQARSPRDEVSAPAPAPAPSHDLALAGAGADT